MINLVEVLTGTKNNISLDGTYQIDKSYYENSSIINLDNVTVKGSVQKENDDNIYIDVMASSKMCIKDSITLEEIWYPFSFQIRENLSEIIEKNENTLDIIELLWQNIVLEVPLRYTTVKDYSKYHGDGWKLVSEEELSNNPFSALLKDEDRSD